MSSMLLALPRKISEYPTLSNAIGTEWLVVAYLDNNYKVSIDNVLSKVTKLRLGLGNVDNTSDALKPISIAVAQALQDKAHVNHTHIFGVPDITGLELALNGKASFDHTHSEYALATHTHSDYAHVGHSHGDYALTLHTHSQYAPLASPEFTGTPTAPTAAPGTNTSQLATTAFVQASLLDVNIPHASTEVAGKIQIATFNEVIQGVDNLKVITPATLKGVTDTLATSTHTHNGYADVNHTHTDFALQVHTHPEYAQIDTPAFTGTPTAPTAAPGTNTSQLATTEFVQSATPLASTSVAGKVILATESEVLAGDDNDKVITLTVLNSVAGTLAPMNHEHDQYAPIESPEFTGTPTAPTAEPGTNTTQIATTEWVQMCLLDMELPYANTEVAGKVILASDEEVLIGTNTTAVVTPASLKNVTNTLAPALHTHSLSQITDFINDSCPVTSDVGISRTLLDSDAGNLLRFTDPNVKTVHVDGAESYTPEKLYHISNRAATGDLTLAGTNGMVLNPPKGGSLILEPGDTVTLHCITSTMMDVHGSTKAA